MSDSDPSRGNEYVADVVGIEPDAPFDRVRSLIENLIVWLGQREPVAPGDPFTKFITGGRLVSLGLVTEADIRGDDNEQPDDEDAIEPEMVVVHAREMFPSVTNGCGTLTITELASTKPNLQTLEFVKVGQTSAQFMLIMPPGWVGGSFQFRVYWSHSTGGSTFGTAWRLRAHSVTDGETMSEAFSGSMLVTDTGGTADDLYISPESDPVQISGTQAKAGDLVMCEISRIVTDSGDTLNIPARLHAIRFNVGDAPAEFPPEETVSTWDSTTETGTWTFSSGDATADHVSGVGVVNVHGTAGHNSGKRYFEISADAVFTVFHTGVRHDLGVTEVDPPGSGGSDVQGAASAGQNGACYRIGGAIMVNGSSAGSVTAVADGDVIGVAIDIDTGKVWFSLNGTWTQGDPATDTSPEGTLAAGSTYRPGIAVESGAHLTATLRTTLAEFSTAPPSGFTSWATT